MDAWFKTEDAEVDMFMLGREPAFASCVSRKVSEWGQELGWLWGFRGCLPSACSDCRPRGVGCPWAPAPSLVILVGAYVLAHSLGWGLYFNIFLFNCLRVAMVSISANFFGGGALPPID